MSEENQKQIGKAEPKNQATDLELFDGAATEDKQNSKKSDGMFLQLALVSAKTLYYLFLILAVLAVFISQRFPYLSMRFYYDMGDYSSAAKYAKIYCERGGKNRTEALLYGIEMSEILLHESGAGKAQKPAEYLLYFSSEFAGLSATEFANSCASMDNYYRDCYKSGMISTVAAAGLFSFKDYVFGAVTAAMSALGQVDRLLYDGTYRVAEQGVILEDELVQMFADIMDGRFAPNPQELAVLYNQISQNIKWGGGSLVFDARAQSTTLLYDLMISSVCSQDGDYSFVSECQRFDDTIEKLYYIGSALSLYYNLEQLFAFHDQAEEMQNLQNSFLINTPNEITLAQYFDIVVVNCAAK